MSEEFNMGRAGHVRAVVVVLLLLLTSVDTGPGSALASDPPAPGPSTEDPTPVDDGVLNDTRDNGTKVKVKTIKDKPIDLLHNTWSYVNGTTEVQVNVTGDRTRLLIVHPDVGNVTLDMSFEYGKGKTFVKTKDKERISYKTSDLNMTFAANTSGLKEVIVVEKEKDKLFPLNWTVNVTSEWGLTITRDSRTIRVDGIPVFWLQPFTATNVTNATVALNETYSGNATSFNVTLDLDQVVDKDAWPLTIDPTVTIDVTDTTDLDTRNIAVDSSGTLYTAYYDGTSVEYQTSTDRGVTWGGATTVYTASGIVQVVMCVDSNDNLHFAWKESDGSAIHKCYWVGNSTWSSPFWIRGLVGSWQALVPDGSGNVYVFHCAGDLYTRKWDGDSWGTSQSVRADQGPDEQRPEAAVSSNGTVHVVWQGYDGSDYGIFYSVSTDGGSTYTTPSQIDDDLGACVTPTVAIDSNDDVHVSWQGKNATHTNTQICFRRYDASASSWGSVTYLTDHDGAVHRQSSIAVDRLGNLYVIYCDQELSANYRVAYRRSTDGGTSWEGNVTAVDDTYSSAQTNALHYSFPSDCGNVPYRGFMFSYKEDVGGTPDYTIYYSSDFILSPTLPAKVDDSTTSDGADNLMARTPDGRLHTLINVGTRPWHYYSDDGGLSWTAHTMLGRGSGTSSAIDLVALSNGNLWALEYYSTGAIVDYQVYDNTTDTWGSYTQLGSGNGGSLAVDSNDRIYVIYTYSTSQDVWYRFWDGSTLTGYPSLDQNGYYADVYVDRFDRAHMVYWDNALSRWVYRINHVGYNYWTDEEVITTDTTKAGQWSRIVADLNGNPHVVWSTTTTNPDVIWYTNRVGGSWKTPVRISESGLLTSENQMYPTIAIDRNQTLYIGWFGLGSGHANYHTRLSYSTDQGDTWSAPVNVTEDDSIDTYRAYFMGAYWPSGGSGNLSIPTSGWEFVHYNSTDDNYWYNRSSDLSYFKGYDPGINDVPMVTATSPAKVATDVYNTDAGMDLSVTVEDWEGESFDITWYESASAEDGPWYQMGANTSCVDGTYQMVYSNASGLSTTYWWKVELEDSHGNIIDHQFYFTTAPTRRAIQIFWRFDGSPMPSSLQEQPYQEKIVRGPNGNIYCPVTTANYTLKVAYTSDNGATWNYSEVLGGDWRGQTQVADVSIATTSNDTVLLFFYAANADDENNLYLAIRWNWSGPWEFTEVYGQTDASSYKCMTPTMAVNDTHAVLMWEYQNNVLGYRTYELSTRTLAPSWPSSHPTGYDNAYEGGVKLNETGEPWVMWWPTASPGYVYWAPLTTTTQYWSHYWSTSGSKAPGDWGFDRNGILWFTYSLDYLDFHRARIVRSDGPYGTATTTVHDMYFSDSAARTFTPYYGGLSITNDSLVYALHFDLQNFEWFVWYGDLNSSEADWQANMTLINDTAASPDYAYAQGGLKCPFPRVGGLPTSLPPEGFAFYLFNRENASTPYTAGWTVVMNATWPLPGGGEVEPDPDPDPDPDPVITPVNPGGNPELRDKLSFVVRSTNAGLTFIPQTPETWNVIRYEWDLGDGTNTTEEQPTHYYRVSGSYHVTLFVMVEQLGPVEIYRNVTVPEPTTFQQFVHSIELTDGGMLVWVNVNSPILVPSAALFILGVLVIGNVYFWGSDRRTAGKGLAVGLGVVLVVLAFITGLGGV